jgi:hypothetical protein
MERSASDEARVLVGVLERCRSGWWRRRAQSIAVNMVPRRGALAHVGRPLRHSAAPSVLAAALEGAEAGVTATAGALDALAAEISCDPSMLVRAVGGSKPAPPRCSRRTSRMRHLTTPRCRLAIEVACGSCPRSRSARACLRSRCEWRAGRARWAWRWMPHCAGATMAPQDRRHRSRSDKPVRGGSALPNAAEARTGVPPRRRRRRGPRRSPLVRARVRRKTKELPLPQLSLRQLY